MKKENNAIILFADLVGSARLSDILSPKDYDRVVDNYQTTASKIISKYKPQENIIKHCDGGVRGDEFVLIFTLQDGNDNDLLVYASYAAALALRFAVELKLL